jgi:hypothetical protein
MERWVENTLATLGMIVTAIFVIAACVFVFLLAICFGVLNSSGSFNHSNPPPTSSPFLAGAYGIMAVIILVGVIVICLLARSMIRKREPQALPYLQTPTGVVPNLGMSKIDPRSESKFEPRFEPKIVAPPVPPASVPPSVTAISASSSQARVRDLAAHLSPASRAVVQQLGIAITAKIAAEVVLGLVGWYGALGSPRVPFPVYRFGFIAWGLAAIAPHIVLLYALARHPGPRAFAYSLVIPTLHILLGFFGHSAFLAFILRAGQVAAPLFSIAPWILDIVILYLAWKAIRQTGIHPNPARLIVASVVILVYTSLLPLLVVVLNGFQH